MAKSVAKATAIATGSPRQRATAATVSNHDVIEFLFELSASCAINSNMKRLFRIFDAPAPLLSNTWNFFIALELSGHDGRTNWWAVAVWWCVLLAVSTLFETAYYRRGEKAGHKAERDELDHQLEAMKISVETNRH